MLSEEVRRTASQIAGLFVILKGMGIGQLKPIIGKWQFAVDFSWRDWNTFNIKPSVRVFCLNMIKIPTVGYLINKNDYRGFILKIYNPFCFILSHRFVLKRPEWWPRRLMRLWRFEYRAIDVPIKIGYRPQ